MLGIVGEPGARKSTFAEQLLAQVEHRQPGLAVSVSMDGFHLSQKVIAARGLTAGKGTIETFEVKQEPIGWRLSAVFRPRAD